MSRGRPGARTSSAVTTPAVTPNTVSSVRSVSSRPGAIGVDSCVSAMMSGVKKPIASP